jgi:Nucleotidyl transferase AbiEii toxin, Type IV TA system
VSARTPQQAYLELQKLARAQGHNTQQLFELYIHERFLARLAESRFAEQFVLKGGMLLAVLDVRRPTRDADMLARGVASDEGNLRAVIGEIATISMADGVSFDATEISVVLIREDAEYEGVRVSVVIDGVVDFIDGLQDENVSRWNPVERRWE